jgi:hypothetical protein
MLNLKESCKKNMRTTKLLMPFSVVYIVNEVTILGSCSRHLGRACSVLQFEVLFGYVYVV